MSVQFDKQIKEFRISPVSNLYAFSFNLPFTFREVCFSSYIFYSPVHLYVPLWLLELMSCLGDLLSWCVWIHPTSYFLVIHKSFQNTIVRVLMVFRESQSQLSTAYSFLGHQQAGSCFEGSRSCVLYRPGLSFHPALQWQPPEESLPFCLLCSRPCEKRASHWGPFLLCSACLLASGWLCPCLPVSAQCPFLLELPQIKNFTVQGSLGTEFRGSGHLAFHTAIVQHPQCSGVPGLFLVGLCKTFK